MGVSDTPSPRPTEHGQEEIAMPNTRAFSPLQSLFLARLVRLLRQRRDYASVLGSDDWRMRLLNKSIYSTFCDCLELGIADEARALFAHK